MRGKKQQKTNQIINANKSYFTPVLRLTKPYGTPQRADRLMSIYNVKQIVTTCPALVSSGTVTKFWRGSVSHWENRVCKYTPILRSLWCRINKICWAVIHGGGQHTNKLVQYRISGICTRYIPGMCTYTHRYPPCETYVYLRLWIFAPVLFGRPFPDIDSWISLKLKKK